MDPITLNLIIWIALLTYVPYKLYKKIDVSLTILTLTTLVSVNSLAETATSGNLLPNAGASQSSYQNTTDSYTPDKD